MRGGGVRADLTACAAARSGRCASYGRPGDAARSHRGAESSGAGHPATAARQDEGELRAGEGLRHEARLATNEGAARATAAGDAAEARAGALGDAAEEVSDHPAGDACPHG